MPGQRVQAAGLSRAGRPGLLAEALSPAARRTRPARASAPARSLPRSAHPRPSARRRGILVSDASRSGPRRSALDGRYELHEVLGEGSFGRVYRGRDRRLGRVVAVKVIKPWWAEDDAWVERFQREARLLARVSDPGVVRIFDIGEAEEGPYYVAELVEGESLADRLRAGRCPPRRRARSPSSSAPRSRARTARASSTATSSRRTCCSASDGRVKVGDFGVARLAEGTSQAPSATVAGTPRYMSPEQARGLPDDPGHRRLQRGRRAVRDARRQAALRRRFARRAGPAPPPGPAAAAAGRSVPPALRAVVERRWPRSRASATPTGARWSARCNRPRRGEDRRRGRRRAGARDRAAAQRGQRSPRRARSTARAGDARARPGAARRGRPP